MRSQPKKPRRWVLLVSLTALVVIVLYTSVSLPPASGQAASAESELLARQLEFMLKMNTAFLGFLGTVGVLLTWFFKNNLDDAKQVAGEIVEKELQGQVRALVAKEVEAWERTVLPERIVGETKVDYFLPEGQHTREEISEVKLLETRGFRKPVRFCTTEQALRSLRGDITILDLENKIMPSGQPFRSLPDDERKDQAQALIENLLKNVLPASTVLVVYSSERLNLIKPAYPTQYVVIANNRVTLLSHAANTAYVAYSDR